MLVRKTRTLLLVGDTLDVEPSPVFCVEVPACSRNLWESVDSSNQSSYNCQSSGQSIRRTHEGMKGL